MKKITKSELFKTGNMLVRYMFIIGTIVNITGFALNVLGKPEISKAIKDLKEDLFG